MQQPETNINISPSGNFNPFPVDNASETDFPVRDVNNVKLQAADLFSLFTANIIQEDVTFTR